MKYSKKVWLFSKCSAAAEIRPTKLMSSATPFTSPERVVFLQQYTGNISTHTSSQKVETYKAKLFFCPAPPNYLVLYFFLSLSSNGLLPTWLQTWPSCQCYENPEFLNISAFSANKNIFQSEVKTRTHKVACSTAEALQQCHLILALGNRHIKIRFRQAYKELSWESGSESSCTTCQFNQFCSSSFRLSRTLHCRI